MPSSTTDSNDWQRADWLCIISQVAYRDHNHITDSKQSIEHKYYSLALRTRSRALPITISSAWSIGCALLRSVCVSVGHRLGDWHVCVCVCDFMFSNLCGYWITELFRICRTQQTELNRLKKYQAFQTSKYFAFASFVETKKRKDWLFVQIAVAVFRRFRFFWQLVSRTVSKRVIWFLMSGLIHMKSGDVYAQIKCVFWWFASHIWFCPIQYCSQRGWAL